MLRYRVNLFSSRHRLLESIITYQLDQELNETLGDCQQRHVVAGRPNRSRRRWVVADFIAFDSSLSVYHRFAMLTARRLAILQLELFRLERQWKLLDRQCRTRPNSDDGEDSELENRLQDLLSEIDQKLEKYLSPWQEHRTDVEQKRLCFSSCKYVRWKTPIPRRNVPPQLVQGGAF